MEVHLMTHYLAVADMEYNAAYAMLTCHANTDKLNTEGSNVFIERAIKVQHDTIIEHINLTFEINWLSRACLQELSRHRHTSLSVESTRHTLKKHVFDDKWCAIARENVMVNPSVFDAEVMFLRRLFNEGMGNDEAKYYLREYWPTQLVITLNIRELRHILKLRTHPAALKEFQDLCHALFEAVPEDYRYMLEGCIYANNER